MAISFVSSTTSTSVSNSSSLTINKPTGVADGDFLLAYVTTCLTGGGSQITVTAPSGWTKIREIYATDAGTNAGFNTQLTVLSRSALASDPSTWSVTFSRSIEPKTSAVVCYRGVSGIVVENGSNAGTTSSYNTATVNNTIASGAWRVTAAHYNSATLDWNIAINDVTRRAIDGAADSNNAQQVVAYDSNAAISAGNTSRTVSRSQNWDSSSAWIAILQSSSNTSGTLDMTVTGITMTSDGTVSNDATLDMTAPMATMSMDGIFIADVGGPLTADVGVTMSVNAAIPTTGTLDIVAVSVQFVGETAPSGPRIAKVEPESRTYYAVHE